MRSERKKADSMDVTGSITSKVGVQAPETDTATLPDVGRPISRNTVQRSLVRDTVYAMHEHPTSEEIYDQVKAKHPGISRATVYRNLNVLAQAGDILRVEIPNAADRFDFTTTPHYHVKCRECGRVFDVDMPYLNDLTQRIVDDHGFKFESHQIVFSGICPRCT